ncbi:MAG: hypothetical protein ACK559_03325, partial [bacterium]
LPHLELPLDLLEVGEAVVVEEPVLQDVVGRVGVRVRQNILDEPQGILGERLDHVEVAVLL